jgi:hypothetical protein
MTERINKHIWTLSTKDLATERDFIHKEIGKIGTSGIEELIKVASAYRKNAYTPYSHYDVGAAVLTIDNEIYGGCNSENVAYSPTNHA